MDVQTANPSAFACYQPFAACRHGRGAAASSALRARAQPRRATCPLPVAPLAGVLAGLCLVPSRHRHDHPLRCRGRHGHVAVAARAAEDNVALVFVKPHACTPQALELVPSFLEQHGLKVMRSGTVPAKQVEEKGIIDAHYAAIAKVGMARDMAALGLGAGEAAKFEAGYSRTLEEALRAGEVCSAVTAMEVLDVSPGELLQRCLAAGYEKLRSGLYCAKLEGGPTGQLYVLNGFYARMREKFTAPGVVVHWFVVSWKEADLSWKNFRSQVIGATNPEDAAAGSLRARIRDEWKSLGLKEETNYQDNGVHASASPLEALRERMVWLGDDVDEDAFGQAVSERSSLSAAVLVEDPVLELADGRVGSAFDLLEDSDAAATLEALAAAKLST
eukprot:TRINITY_DN67152_c0_g1_i1.p1 TRINITY_DN67152_c0_g1~~TRINITY_DN67152_c0_g1_i1.p1  ORF type:complete len:389 (-),score=88.27 TRINITY_DN67152_c0_g1_i1:26-1192(-)